MSGQVADLHGNRTRELKAAFTALIYRFDPRTWSEPHRSSDPAETLWLDSSRAGWWWWWWWWSGGCRWGGRWLNAGSCSAGEGFSHLTEGKLPSVLHEYSGVLHLNFLPGKKMACRVNAKSTKVAAVFMFGPLSLRQILCVKAECDPTGPDLPSWAVWENTGYYDVMLITTFNLVRPCCTKWYTEMCRKLSLLGGFVKERHQGRSLKCLSAHIYILFPPSFELQRAEKLLFHLRIQAL